jgi:hypothetical protein
MSALGQHGQAERPGGYEIGLHLGCVKWICQVNGVGLFSHTHDHRFAFSTQATDKMYGRVIFELLKVCDCVHVYINLVAVRTG